MSFDVSIVPCASYDMTEVRAALSAALDARNLVLCVLALVLCMPAAPALRAKLERLRCAAALRGALALLLFLLCLMTLAANSFQLFIYASF